MKIKPLQIYQAPLETGKLFSQTFEKFKKANKSDDDFYRSWMSDFNSAISGHGFFSFDGQLGGLWDRGEKITLIRRGGKNKTSSFFGSAFRGTPTKLKKTLEKILDEMERKEKLQAFK